MNFNLISVFLALGIVQGLVSAMLLLFTRNRSTHNKLLAAFLIGLSFTLIPTFLGQLGLVDQYSFLPFLPLDFSLFLFPLLFLYVSSITNLKSNSTTDYKHYLIGIIFWLYAFVVWILTLGAEQKGEVLLSVYFFDIQYLSQIIWVMMIFFYSKKSFGHLSHVAESRLSKSQLQLLPWARGLFILFLVLAIIELGSLLSGKHYGYWKGSPLDEWLGVSFAMVLKATYAIALYLVAFVGYSRFRKLSYNTPKLSSFEVDTYAKRITSVMEQEKLYLNPNFTLSDLAKSVGSTTVNISSLLNNELKISFNDFINRYRVEAVKQKLSTDEINKYTLQSIALASGFKSKTTFYRAFQKFTKQSPTDYLQQLRQH